MSVTGRDVPRGQHPRRGRLPHFFLFLARRGQRLQSGFALQHFFLTFFDTGQPNSITLRMPSWASISSKPLFTSSSDIRCEMKESTSMSPAR
jgi:hypothetical protein